MSVHTYEVVAVAGRQVPVRALSCSTIRCHWVAALLLFGAASLSAATKLSSFPVKPAEMDQMRWTALQNAAAATIPPGTELVSNDGGEYDSFGFSVALSGTTALVGAFYKPIGANSQQGAVYVFTFTGNTWVQTQELTASDGAAADGFGYSVALSGSTAVVGAEHKAIGANTGQGAAYVFTFNGSTWSQQQKLTAGDGTAGDNFGYSVALSGTTAVVGAEHKTVGANTFQGAAYVFTANGSTWSQQQELTVTDGASGDNFGAAVALAGTTTLVGAYGKTVGSNTYQGAAYVFTSSGNVWSQQQKLTANDGAISDEFGYSVALSDTTAVVGAQHKTIGANTFQGAAYVFTANGSMWSQQQELTASDGAMGDEFGNSVALSGTTAVVGAFNKAAAGLVTGQGGEGAAYIFQDSGTTWVQQQELTANDGAFLEEFGYAVALSGSTALVGAPNRTIGSNSSQGVAYVFNTDTIFCDGFDATGLCR